MQTLLKLSEIADELFSKIGKDMTAIFIVNQDGLLIHSKVVEDFKFIPGNIEGSSCLALNVLERLKNLFLLDERIFSIGTFDLGEYRVIFSEAGDAAIMIVLKRLLKTDPAYSIILNTSQIIAKELHGVDISKLLPQLKEGNRLEN